MIELVDVSKSYNSIKILEEVSFSFEKGSRTAIIGPSGSGKTTLLNLIAGLIPLDKGMIRMDGKVTDTPGGSVHPSMRNMGFAFQFPSLWPHLTVKRNILYGMASLDKTGLDKTGLDKKGSDKSQLGKAGAYKKDRQERYAEMLEALEISDIADKYPGEISGGQAKRVSLARTLIVKPGYLLLDEPLNNLDRNLKDKVLKLIRELVASENMTLIHVTHDLQEAESICDRFCCIEDRKIRGLSLC